MPGRRPTAGGAAGSSVITGSVLLGYGVAKLVPGLLTLASVPIWVRLAGASEYATFALVWILTGTTTALSVGWIGQAALRSSGDDSRGLARLPRAPLVGAVLAPALPVGIWVLATTGGAAGGRVVALLAASVLYCVLSGAYSLAGAHVQRDQRSTRFAVAETVRVVGGLLASVGLLRYDPSAVGILVGNVLGTAAGLWVLAGSAAPRVWSAGRTSRHVLRSYWRYGWPMSLWFGASFLLNYVDRFAIAALLGKAEAGRYAAAADTITRGMGIVGFPLSVAVYSAVMTEWNAGRLTEARAALVSAGKMLVAVLVPCVVGAAVVGPWVLGLLVPGNSLGRGAITLLAVGAALWQCALLAHKTLEIAGRSKLMLGVLLVAAVTTAGLDVLLVPFAGITGAAAAFALGAALYTGTCLVVGPPLLRRHAAVDERSPYRIDAGKSVLEGSR
jgi:O-antigen/teichoic acid export membrane protein